MVASPVIIPDFARMEDFPVLSRGAHSPGTGVCFNELVAHVIGLPWTDEPASLPWTISRLTLLLNDRMPDDERQRLRAYVPRVYGLDLSLAADQRRAFLAADRAVRVFAAAALDAAGLGGHAARLRALPPIVDAKTARSAAAAAVARDSRNDAACAAAYAADAVVAAAYAADAVVAAAYAADAVADNWLPVLTLLDDMIAA